MQPSLLVTTPSRRRSVILGRRLTLTGLSYSQTLRRFKEDTWLGTDDVFIVSNLHTSKTKYFS